MKEALKLALKALYTISHNTTDDPRGQADKAITAIKEALAQPAVAEQHKQEPVAKNEEGRITWLVDDWPQNCFLYAEPPKWTPVEIGVDVTSEGAHVVAMYLLPDAVRYVFYSQFHTAPQPEQAPVEKAMTAHRAAYFMERFKHEEKLLGPNEQAALDFVISMLEAQPAVAEQHKQEPVAHFGSAYVNENGVHITTVLGPVAIPQDAKLYTTPPQRTWVGLTDKEAHELWESTDSDDDWELMKRTEAKLKEKNT